MSELDERFTGRLSVNQYAVLFYDEICTMQKKDPEGWIDPRKLEDAKLVYEAMQTWSRYKFDLLHRWLKRSP